MSPGSVIKENPSLGQVINFFKLTQLWKEGRGIVGTFMCLIVYTFNSVYFMSIIYRLFLPNPDFRTLLCYSLFFLGIYKITTFTIRFNEWKQMISFFSSLELEALNDGKTKHAKVVIKYIGRVKFVIKLFTVTAVGSNILLVIRLWISNIVYRPVLLKYFDSGLPFDETTDVGFYLHLVFQTIFMEVESLYEILWDLIVFGGLVFYIGQFKALKCRCESALDVDDEDTCLKNIIDCHKHYIILMENKKLFNSLISPSMLLYLFAVTGNLALAIGGITANQGVSQLSFMEFVFALMFQLLLLYGLANEIIVQSNTIVYSVFKSDWVRSSTKVKRAVLLLGTGMGQRVVFTAGPFVEMSLETYVAILRVTYSFYTLLSSTK